MRRKDYIGQVNKPLLQIVIAQRPVVSLSKNHIFFSLFLGSASAACTVTVSTPTSGATVTAVTTVGSTTEENSWLV